MLQKAAEFTVHDDSVNVDDVEGRLQVMDTPDVDVDGVGNAEINVDVDDVGDVDDAYVDGGLQGTDTHTAIC